MTSLPEEAAHFTSKKRSKNSKKSKNTRSKPLRLNSNRNPSTNPKSKTESSTSTTRNWRTVRIITRLGKGLSMVKRLRRKLEWSMSQRRSLINMKRDMRI